MSNEKKLKDFEVHKTSPFTDTEKLTKKDLVSKVLSLSAMAQKTYKYISDTSSYNIVLFDKKDCAVFCGYKANNYNTIYLSIYELLENGFIARHEKRNFFFINRNLF